MIVLKISSNHSNVLSIPGAQTLGRQCDFYLVFIFGCVTGIF